MNYFLKKSTRICTTLFIVLTLNFIMPRMMPGDPVIMLLGQDAAAISSQDLAALSSQFGLDKPILHQFGAYWLALAAGNLGYSFHYCQPVSDVIGRHMIPTLLMLFPAIFISTMLALLLGALAGWLPGSKLDLVLTYGSLIIYAMPQFLTAMLLLQFLGFEWNIVPLSGLFSTADTLNLSRAVDLAWHLALPIAILTIGAASSKLPVMRNSIIQYRRADFITYAIAKGLSPARILIHHVLRNACLPLIGMAALNLGIIASGALVVEIVFSINGMGTLIYEAALYRDSPLLQGCFLILTLVVISANALADLAYGLIDPRISHYGKTS